jgi:hypothetical protein
MMGIADWRMPISDHKNLRSVDADKSEIGIRQSDIMTGRHDE